MDVKKSLDLLLQAGNPGEPMHKISLSLNTGGDKCPS